MSTPTDPRNQAEAAFAAAQAKTSFLAQIDPVLLDVSLREPCFSSYYGHTLETKQQLLPLVERFGIADKVIATLDFQDPDYPQVENEFCDWLQSTGYDMTGCFALTAVGAVADGVFVPDLSMVQLKNYGIPNTLHEIYLMTPDSADHALVVQRIGASIDWLRANIVGDRGGAPRIYLNVVDLVDAFFADRDWCCEILALLAAKGVDALSFEDGRGTYFPHQIAAMVTAAKAYLNPGQKVLFHCHAGNGMENASVIEALLAGADGYWAGLDKESSTIGHASMSELLANLVRAGNRTVASRYAIDQLVPIAQAMHQLNDEEDVPQTWPLIGANAYRQMLSGFDQQAGRAMDLPPEAIGTSYTFRISPDGSDWPVVQGRVLELLGERIDADTATRMILLMRQDLNCGLRIRYDDADQLSALLQRAQPARAA